MFPVTAETTVSVSERAHLPSNMFSIPQAEPCAARLRKRPPTEQMAEPGNTGDGERLRKSLGWSPWQEQREGAVGGILDRLHFTEASNKHTKSGSASLPCPSLLLLPPLLPLPPFFLLLSYPLTILSLLFLPLSFSRLMVLLSFFPPMLSSSSPSPLPMPSFCSF